MASYDYERGELDFLDRVTLFGLDVGVLSLIIGLQNLELNQKQVNNIMSEMTDKQNKMLAEIIEQNKVLIEQNKILLKKLGVETE